MLPDRKPQINPLETLKQFQLFKKNFTNNISEKFHRKVFEYTAIPPPTHTRGYIDVFCLHALLFNIYIAYNRSVRQLF